MYAIISLLLVVALSLLVIRIGTVALVMTGLSEEIASFQSLSAFSGAGFTTEEAEDVLAYDARRKVVKALIRLGSVGAITAISSLVISFADPATRLRRLVVLVVAAGVLISLARSGRFNRALTPLIERSLQRTATFQLRDYTSLLHLHQDYRIADLSVSEGDWLASAHLADLDLPAEGVVVLGIRREGGTYVGAPSADHEIHPGDTVIAYGQESRLRELADRHESDREAHQDARDEHRRRRAAERERDSDVTTP